MSTNLNPTTVKLSNNAHGSISIMITHTQPNSDNPPPNDVQPVLLLLQIRNLQPVALRKKAVRDAE